MDEKGKAILKKLDEDADTFIGDHYPEWLYGERFDRETVVKVASTFFIHQVIKDGGKPK